MDSEDTFQQPEQRLVEARWRIDNLRFRFLIDPERARCPACGA